jgi:hypothetical protein
VITGRRVLISLLLGLAFAGFFYAFTRPTDSQQPPFRDVAVKHIEPTPGELVLRQTEIFVEVAAGYDAELFVDDLNIPRDQVRRTGMRYSFTPGEEKVIEELAPGRRCVKVELWDTTVEGSPHRNYGWCFEVH